MRLNVKTNLVLLSGILCIGFFVPLHAGGSGIWVVSKDGKGDFTSIASALNALPSYSGRMVIYIREGEYNEKIRIDRDEVTLRGENRLRTRIQYAQKRSDWETNRDWIGPGVVNLHGDDIIIENLTIENTQPEIEPHAFALYGNGTRTILVHCDLLSRGGDTVALWNYKTGMYYLKDCRIQGAVDMLCPRGWCHAEDCQFFEVKSSASVWHDGQMNPLQKMVFVNCTFDGVPGFCLARHHYDAQFFFIRCHFSKNLADRPVYRHRYSEPEKNTPEYWGERNYFSDCQKEGKPFDWYRDSLPIEVHPDSVSPFWTFDHQWNPEDDRPIAVIGHEIRDSSLLLIFDTMVTVRGVPVLRNENGKRFRLRVGKPINLDRLLFETNSIILPEDHTGLFILEQGEVIGSVATIQERRLDKIFTVR